MYERLTGLKNPKVMLWRSLKDRKARLESGLFLVEGRKMVEEALSSSFPPEAILVQEDRIQDFPFLTENLRVYLLPESVLASVCDVRTPQGIAAVLHMADTQASGTSLVALDGVQDPGNVGTIIRTADAAGFSGVILSRECADPFSPKVLRATMGSIFRMGITVTEDLPAFLRQCRETGFSVLSSQLDGTPFFERENVSERFCLVIGNEGNGVSEPVKAEATHRLKLPMKGGAESLNAAIAAAIMMYDLTRNRD